MGYVLLVRVGLERSGKGIRCAGVVILFCQTKRPGRSAPAASGLPWRRGFIDSGGMQFCAADAVDSKEDKAAEQGQLHLGCIRARMIALIGAAQIRVFVLLPAIGNVNLDFIDTIGADVNKLGNVDGAIGSRSVVDQDCRGVVAVASRCVRYICVYGDRAFDENTSQWPFGEKLCQEFIRRVLARRRRGVPPADGIM